MSNTYGKEIKLEGKVVDADGCYHVPRIIKVNCDGAVHSVFTWLFLYNGAFQNGDIVEFTGIHCRIGGQEYVLVDALNHYIKIVSCVGSEGFSTFTFRKAVRIDLLSIVNLLNLSEVDDAFVLPLSQRLETIESRVHTRFNRGFWMTVWDGNILCGCWAVSYDSLQEMAMFSTLVVRPGYQGKGLGKQLMQESIKQCVVEYNPKKMQFDSWNTNQALAVLAARLGFIKVAEYDEPNKRPIGIKNVLYERVCRR